MTATDRFGNEIDSSVGYARGALLGSSADEVRRLRHAQRVASDVVARRGIDSVGIFTGNPRRFPLGPGDLDDWCEEWVGPGLFADQLRRVAVEHLGGKGHDVAAVTNRTSGGIVAAILALAGGRTVVSVVPDGDRSHASVVRGCRLAGTDLVEVVPDQTTAAVAEHGPELVVVTTVTSSLARMEDAEAMSAIEAARSSGAVIFLDEAYGARVRPVLHDGVRSLELGADAAITNTDKAGLEGPRAGVLVGREAVVVPIVARAAELGIDARAPIAAGALRSLESFDPGVLRREAADGREVARALEDRLGAGLVHRSDLGPRIGEEDAHAMVLERVDGAVCDLVPCESTAAIAMLLLRDHGVVTVNTHGQPGGRVSLRLKPTAGAVERVGGAETLVAALDDAITTVAAGCEDREWMERLLFGEAGGVG